MFLYNVKRLYRTSLFNLLVPNSRYSYSSVNNNDNNNSNNSNNLTEGLKVSQNFNLNRKVEFDENVKYFTPTYTNIENFEEKFWEALNEKSKTSTAIQDAYPNNIRFRKFYKHPIERAFGVVKDDILEFFSKLKKDPVGQFKPTLPDITSPEDEQKFPYSVDVVIIGGGIVGTSIAFHLQERTRGELKVLVIEKDLSYSKASTVLSVGGIRQQFSVPENILLSKYGMDFLQQADTRLAIKDEPPPDFGLTFGGYLTLANENGYPQLLQNYELQKDHGCFVEMYSKQQLKEHFPWINTDGVEAGVYGVQREGWFDPWSFLLAVNRKSKELGAKYLNASVTGADVRILGSYVHNEDTPTAPREVRNIMVTLRTGETKSIQCAMCVIAAGAWSKEVGMLFGIGKAPSGINSIPIPVEPRKRYVYCVKSPEGPILNCPLVIDTDGAYFRREGLADLYLCGRAPQPEEEPPTDNLEVDYNFFEEKVWPSIANRCSSFERLKMFSSWAGYYDYNTFDQNAIIGRHPLFSNLFMATGFSGHGIQQGAGAGAAISELILDQELRTLEIQNLGFERIASYHPITEKCCY